MPQPVDFHGLFVQLQSRFPCSTLVTELVQVYEGSFVVRALVQASGITLATGMAAALSVEVAEDQARLRVLDMLGITSDQVEPAVSGLRSLTTNGYSVNTPLPLPDSAWSTSLPNSISSVSGVSLPSVDPFPVEEMVPPLRTESTLSSIPKQEPEEQGYPKNPELEFDPPEQSLVEDISYLEDSLLPDESSSLSESPRTEDDRNGSSNLEMPPLPKINKPSKPAKATEPSIDEPDDLSSLIALTDVEMDRIGWTKQDGRSHLKQTYGKSTRQKLEVEELLDFLNHLKALPSANGL